MTGSNFWKVCFLLSTLFLCVAIYFQSKTIDSLSRRQDAHFKGIVGLHERVSLIEEVIIATHSITKE